MQENMSNVVNYRVCDEIINFIVSFPPLEQIAAFQPSAEACQRLAELLYKKQSDTLSLVEKQELEQFLFIEHLMRMAKVRAKLPQELDQAERKNWQLLSKKSLNNAFSADEPDYSLNNFI
jgi:hypothetical protein